MSPRGRRQKDIAAPRVRIRLVGTDRLPICQAGRTACGRGAGIAGRSAVPNAHVIGIASEAAPAVCVGAAVPCTACVGHAGRAAPTEGIAWAIAIRNACVERDAAIAFRAHARAAVASSIRPALFVGLASVVDAGGSHGRRRRSGKQVRCAGRGSAIPLECVPRLHTATVFAVRAVCVGLAALRRQSGAGRNCTRRAHRSAGNACGWTGAHRTMTLGRRPFGCLRSLMACRAKDDEKCGHVTEEARGIGDPLSYAHRANVRQLYYGE